MPQLSAETAPSRQTEPTAPPRGDASWAWFLDLDGTLLDIALSPRAVAIPPRLPTLLRALRERFGGALAVVTGRALCALAALLGPERLPAAGQHGAELRFGDGAIARERRRPASLDILAQAFAGLAAAHRGLVVEDKGVSLAIHYRLAPASEPAIRALLQQHRGRLADGLEARDSKQAVDIRLRGTDKGTAVDHFMQMAPFRGRRPLFVGDDTTDRDGFVAALRQNGDALQIGPKISDVAPWFLPSPAALRAWLGRLVVGTAVRRPPG